MASRNIEKAIKLLARETFWNENDFDFAAKALWIGLRARWCGVATIVDGGRRLQVLAYRDKGRKRKAETYDIQGTPCEELYARAADGERQIFIPDNVSELFPDDALLKELGVVNYRGATFRDVEGAPVGHIFALSDEPQPNDLEIRLYFQLVCQRTGDEYRRWRMTEELENQKAKLAESEHLLADAIESITEGFVLYDADERFVLCNDNYREFYPKISDMLVPGTAVEDMVRAMIERGQLADSDDGDAWIRMRLAQYRAAQGAHEQHLSDGRWLLATERRTMDGGFVGIRTDITDRKAAEKEIRDREKSISAILDNVADGIVTADEKGVIESVNPATLKMFGYEEHELLGRNVSIIVPAPHRQQHDSYLKNYLSTGAGKIIGKGARDLEGQRKDGTKFPISLAVSEMRLGEQRLFIGAIRDMTEQRQLLDALRESEEQLRLITDSLPVLIAYVDSDARFRFVNETGAKWYDRPRSTIIGARIEDLFRDVANPEVSQDVSLLQSGQVIQVERNIRYPDGIKRFVRVNGVPHVDENGGIMGFFVIAEDITKIKMTEAEIRDLTNRLIQEQENERRKIARDLHDDLGQRLALLAIELELIAREPQKGGDEFATQIHDLIDRTKSIARSVESVSRQLHPSILEQLGLTKALRGLCAEFGSLADFELAFVDRRAPNSIPNSIALSVYRIAQEALSNIRKHSGAQNAVVELRGNSEEISLTVSDSGAGFDDKTVDAKSLGLVSMKERVRLLGGRFTIQSKIGRGGGTRIEVLIPLSGQPSDLKEQSTKSPSVPTPPITDTDNMPPP